MQLKEQAGWKSVTNPSPRAHRSDRPAGTSPCDDRVHLLLEMRSALDLLSRVFLALNSEQFP